MRKLWIFLTLLAAAALAACGGAAAPAATPTLSASSTTAATATPPEPTAAPISTTAPSAIGECTVVSLLPTPGPTEASLFPPVTDQDWSHGPADARITILEYSDFQ